MFFTPYIFNLKRHDAFLLMCGIFVVHGPVVTNKLPKINVLQHRGPDEFNSKRVGKTFFEFHRLAINGGPGPSQPIECDGLWMVANAEIYNYIQLGGFPGESDCEVIPRCVTEHGMFRACQMLDGDFAFVS